MSRLKSIALVLSGALASMLFCCWLIVSAPQVPSEAETGGNADAPVVVSDKPAPSVPVYTQTDERWGGLPYAGEDLATSGCGLTCAAMAWEFLSGDEWTPIKMLNAVGNSNVQDGQNYMPGFCEWMRDQDASIDYSVIYESRDRAIDDLEGGRLVFGEMQGKLVDGGRSYGGHIVLLTRRDESGSITVHDPCVPYAESLSAERFYAVDWGYFISIGRI